MFFSGQTVLITGGTGSFGQAFANYLLGTDVHKVIIFSRDEMKQHEMARTFTDPRMRFFIGDVRDLSRLTLAFRDVEIVVHAAAMKQVPACEYNPIEAVKTNILGAQNVIRAAMRCDVRKVVTLSSDKAVNPINTYGATKMVAERLFVQGSVYVGARPNPIFSVVRYGNVIGSRGSVVPLFREQAKKGKITVTDERMTRFWMPMGRAIDSVHAAIGFMNGGEIFIPANLPGLPIVTLAHYIVPEADIEYTGIRPGEKLHEVLVSSHEISDLYTGGVYDTMAILPKESIYRHGDYWCPVPANFTYSSDTARVPSREEIQSWLS